MLFILSLFPIAITLHFHEHYVDLTLATKMKAVNCYTEITISFSHVSYLQCNTVLYNFLQW